MYTMIAVKTATVALVGNPNTGKTTLFNALAGMRQRVGNYPGVTVETKKGRLTCGERTFDLIDLPGTYSLAPRSPDEMVAVDLILGHQAGEPRPDVVVSIVDASNLERNLYLTTQMLELGVPVVVALNMMDVAKAHGQAIDVERLTKQLGVPVVPIQANKGVGLDQLRDAIAAAVDRGKATHQPPRFPEAFEREVADLRQRLGADVEPFLAQRLLLDAGGHIELRLSSRLSGQAAHLETARQRLTAANCPIPAIEARTRYAWIKQATAGCVTRPAQRPVTTTDRIDRVLTHKVWGVLVFAVLMFLVFAAIFWAASPLMDAINAAKDWLSEQVKGAMTAGPLRGLLADGLVMGVGGVVVFLPQIMILFAFIAVLEDCGYMARAAYLMDKIMARCGLSGKSFIPMLSSVACAIPGIMAARVIENRRDRFTTILVAPLMSCSARLPVYFLLTAAFLPADVYGWYTPVLAIFGMYMLGFILAPLIALALKSSVLRGETPVFVMEMPLYKWPSIGTVLRRMFDAGWAFIRRAGTIILASMIVVWAVLYFPNGPEFDVKIAALEASIAEEKEELKGLEEKEAEAKKEEKELEEADQKRVEELKAKTAPVDDQINHLNGERRAQSYLGQLGHMIEPLVAPLGWDWRIGTAALASFPAREVVVGTLGILYDVGDAGPEEGQDLGDSPLGQALKKAEWDHGPRQGQRVFTVPVALSLMVFFALCAQCASTLAVIKRETGSWGWPVFAFVYMTALAYVGALLVYQVGTLLSA